MISCVACAVLTFGRRRPIMRSQWPHARPCEMSICSGAHNSAEGLSTLSKLRGITPITVYVFSAENDPDSSRVICLPMTAGSPPKRSCHNLSLRIATFGACKRSSEAWKSLPTTGDTPNTWK